MRSLLGSLAWAIVAAAGLLPAASAAAAAEDPPLRIVVTGSGALPAAATLVVASIDGATRHEAALTRDGAPPVFGALHPAAYEVSVSMPDGRIARLPLRLEKGRTSVLVVILPPDAVTPPALELRHEFQSIEGTRFGPRALRDLPTADDAWSLVETAAPFVVADRVSTGGLGLGGSALVSTRGESWALAGVSFGGIPVRSPTPGGRLPIVPDMHAAQALVATSGLAPVEVETPGLVLDIVPRRAGDRWMGAIDTSVTTPGMVGENALPDAPSLERIEDWRAASVGAGGPVGEQAGLFVSAGFARATHLERDQPPVQSARTRSLTSRFDAMPRSGHHLRVLGGFEAAEYPFDDRRQLAETDVTERARFGRGQVQWSSGGASGSHRMLAVSFQRGAWRPDVVAGAAGGVVDRVFHGVVPRPPADVVHGQFDARAGWSGAVRRWGNLTHELRAGLSYRRTTASRETLALPTVVETVQHRIARIWVPQGSPLVSSRHLHETALYLADRIAVGPSLTIELGIRGDLTRGSTEASETALHWNTLSPRASFRWHHEAVSLFGGVGRYAAGHPIAFLAFGDPGEVTWQVHGWDDRDGDPGVDDGEAAVVIARAGFGPSVASIDPDLRVPRSTEWTAGIELRPTAASTLRGAIVIRRQTQLAGVLNTGLTAADYRVFTIDDIGADELSPDDDQRLPIYERLPSSYGRDQLLLTNPEAADPVRHDGIELTYEITSARWLMIFGASAYRTVGRGGALGFRAHENDPLVLGDRYWNPNALRDAEGRLFFDRAYVGKWTTAYRAPGDIRLAAVVRYQDGQPFTRYASVPPMAGGADIIHAYPMGRTRFTYTATVDARIEKGVSWGAGRRAAVRLDIFNLTNHANELEEDVWTGPEFRRSTIVQPPRTLRLGVRVEF